MRRTTSGDAERDDHDKTAADPRENADIWHHASDDTDEPKYETADAPCRPVRTFTLFLVRFDTGALKRVTYAFGQCQTFGRRDKKNKHTYTSHV